VTRRSRLRVGVGTTVRSLLREPVQVLVVAALPLVVIEGYGIAMESFPAFPFMDAVPSAMGRVNGAIYASALLAAVLGLFQVISARQADERLRLCGYPPAELFAARLGAVGGASLLVAGLSLAALSWRVDVGAPTVAFAALAAAALVYGLIGMLVGAALPRALEGSLVLVFLIDADDFLSSGMLDIDSPLLSVFPLAHPHELLRTAVFEGSLASGPALATGAYLAVLLALVGAVYVALTGGVVRG
jgi:hypothetical protein